MLIFFFLKADSQNPLVYLFKGRRPIPIQETGHTWRGGGLTGSCIRFHLFNKINQAGLGPATSNPSKPCIGSSAMASRFRLEFSAASLSSSLIACFSSHPS